jgi:hypothetical protein
MIGGVVRTINVGHPRIVLIHGQHLHPGLTGSVVIGTRAAVDPSGFAELSLCDRHAFAPSAPRNRTAIVPSREKRMQSCPAASSRRFLRSGLRVCIAAFGPFPAIVAAIRRNFSAIQTAWRRGRDSRCRFFYLSVILTLRQQYAAFKRVATLFELRLQFL